MITLPIPARERPPTEKEKKDNTERKESIAGDTNENKSGQQKEPDANST